MLVIEGDALTSLRKLPDACVHCCVTSPAYWGLTDYGTASRWTGGDPACPHGGIVRRCDDTQAMQRLFVFSSSSRVTRQCALCGAVRAADLQIGLEPTPKEYVARLVEVFGEVRRVLVPEGTLWLVMGDCYMQKKYPGALKRKDLAGIPWRLALALQEDGWYLRADVIWHKTSKMPEKVFDRPTRCHEYLFLLSKSERYYYDDEAIREVAVSSRARPGETRNRRSVWAVGAQDHERGVAFTVPSFPPKLIEPCILAGCPRGGVVLDPFAGVFTTALVARRHGRNCVSIELNGDNVAIGTARVQGALNCPVCQRPFKKAGALRNHMQREHPDFNLGPASVCEIAESPAMTALRNALHALDKELEKHREEVMGLQRAQAALDKCQRERDIIHEVIVRLTDDQMKELKSA